MCISTCDELDTVDVDSLTEAFAEELLVTDDFYQGMVSSNEGDFSDPDDGSIADSDRYPGRIPVCQTSLCCTQDELDTMDVDYLTGVFAEKLLVTDGFYQGRFRRTRGFSVIRMMDPLRTMKRILGRIGVVLHLAPSCQKWTVRGRRLCSVTDCFRRSWPIRLFRFMRKCLCWHYGSFRAWG